MFFAFLHELGHLLAGVILGFKPRCLRIMPLGLSIAFNVLPKDYNKKIMNTNFITIKKLIIALAGPITNFIIVLICMYIPNNMLGSRYDVIVYSNILIGVFNLLPIYPLDGGRILKCILQIFCGLKNSIVYTNKISNISIILITAISSICIYYYKNLAILFIVVYLWILVLIENKRYNMKMNLYNSIEKEKIAT